MTYQIVLQFADEDAGRSYKRALPQAYETAQCARAILWRMLDEFAADGGEVVVWGTTTPAVFPRLVADTAVDFDEIPF